MGRTESGLDEMILDSLPTLTHSGSVVDYEKTGPFLSYPEPLGHFREEVLVFTKRTLLLTQAWVRANPFPHTVQAQAPP